MCAPDGSSSWDPHALPGWQQVQHINSLHFNKIPKKCQTLVDMQALKERQWFSWKSNAGILRYTLLRESLVVSVVSEGLEVTLWDTP